MLSWCYQTRTLTTKTCQNYSYRPISQAQLWYSNYKREAPLVPYLWLHLCFLAASFFFENANSRLFSSLRCARRDMSWSHHSSGCWSFLWQLWILTARTQFSNWHLCPAAVVKIKLFWSSVQVLKVWNIKFKLWTWWKIIFVSKLCLSLWGLRQKSQGLIMLMEILIDYHYYTSKEELELFVLFCFLLGSGQFSHSSSIIYPMWGKRATVPSFPLPLS